MNTTHETSRYAVYFAPTEQSALYRAGTHWLGRDVATGEPLPAPKLPEGLSERDWRVITESPRRYGFHATLKPPFSLAAGLSLDDLRGALHDLASVQTCFHAPHLRLGKLGRFLALILSEESAAFNELAAACVRELDRFRAPATESDIARRLRPEMPAKEREHLLRWGYPYVFDTWKFHMTLTNSLDQPLLTQIHEHLENEMVDVCKSPLYVDSVCLYQEPRAGEPFRLIERFSLRATS